MSILDKINTVDQTISKKIHQADNIIITCFLYPFAAFFHPKLIWIAYSAIYILS